jgi:hypothetical protein
MCLGSAVGIATRYGLDGPRFESRWGGEIFRIRPDHSWGQFSLLCDGYRVSFPGVKRPGRGVDHPPPSSAEVKERVFVARSRTSFTFTFTFNVCKDPTSFRTSLLSSSGAPLLPRDVPPY